MRLAGQAAVSSQEPGEREPFGVGEGGLDRCEGSGWGGSGHRAPPRRAEIRRLGQLRVPAIERKPNVGRVCSSHQVTTRRETARRRQPETHSRSPSMSCVFTATSPRTSGTELLVLARFLEGWVHPSKNLACAGRRAGSARRYEAQTRQL